MICHIYYSFAKFEEHFHVVKRCATIFVPYRWKSIFGIHIQIYVEPDPAFLTNGVPDPTYFSDACGSGSSFSDPGIKLRNFFPKYN
jgi:hypothetical protein